MIKYRFRRFPSYIHAVATALLIGMMAGPVTGTEPDGAERFDCGALALHTLLSLEGRETSLQTIREHLPPPHPEGYSLAELKDAAKSCGLALVGVKLNRSDHAPDRSALVLTQLEEHGHFLVVRPVGHSGKLIQVIDPIGDPIVMDAADLYASRQWTGLALIPHRPNWPLRFAISSTVVSGLAFVWLLAGGRIWIAKEAQRPAPQA